jgi:hypothetical protein
MPPGIYKEDVMALYLYTLGLLLPPATVVAGALLLLMPRRQAAAPHVTAVPHTA